MDSYSSKKELGIQANKAIKIKSIDGIFIKNFRKIQNQELKMGKQITIVSGRNGSMKSTLMGLIVHPFQTDEKNVFDQKMSTEFSEVFKLSLEKDDKNYLYNIKMKIKEDDDVHKLEEPVKVYKRSDRFRLVPSGSGPGDGFFTLPTVYINLKRLFPLVEFSEKDVNSKIVSYNENEKKKISQFYESIFGKTSFKNFDTYEAKMGKINKNPIGPGGTDAEYDINSISSGEDNLSSFIQTLLSFERVKEKQTDPDLLTGLLAIDEFESSLHPIAQLNLFEYLLDWSRKNNVQIILNTHSLFLIESVLKKYKDIIDKEIIALNFITNRYSRDLQIYQNTDYKFVKEELTLTSELEHEKLPFKIKILCEDEIAIKYVKSIIGTKVSQICEFISNLSNSSNPGTGWKSLKFLAKNGASLLKDSKSIIVFDADVKDTDLKDIKTFENFIILPSLTDLKLPFEKEIVNYILSLDESAEFFIKFQPKSQFIQQFSRYKIPIDLANISNENVKSYKNWIDSESVRNINKYRNFMIKDKKNRDRITKFKGDLLSIIDRVLQENGAPPIFTE